MGNGHGDAVGRHHQVDAEQHHELADRLDDALPLVVRLRAGQQQVGGPVGHAVQGKAGVVVAHPAVGVEDHAGTPPAVVEQLVGVEGRHH